MLEYQTLGFPRSITMTNLCGHERNDLLCVLRLAVGDDQRNRTKARCECGGPCCVIYNNLIDPAKLAEMLAERGRELGLSVAIYDNHRRFRMSGALVVYALLIVANGFSIMDRDKRGWDFDMSKARAILMQWLQLPNGARGEAERVLRGEL
jgi:hypothetical protein